MEKKLHFPVSRPEELQILNAGDFILISGIIYTARDQAHKRLLDSLGKGEQAPFEIQGSAVYYCGPTPAREDGLFGSAGPTTSGRMDEFTPRLYEMGLSATIGKGHRSEAVREACARFSSVYLITLGGAGAYLAKQIKKQEVVAYPDLGPEAIYRLEVEDFPAVVGIDAKGKVF